MRRDELMAMASRLADGYRLCPPRTSSRGGPGFFLGRRDGQSVDFHDYRQYQPGDDLRRVDWRAYGRSGQMHLKLFREEISPVVEIHLDTSASMAAYPGKEDTSLFLAAFLRAVTTAAEGRPVLCRDGMRFTRGDFLPALVATKFSGEGGTRAPLPQGAGKPVRFFLSDYLIAEDLPGLLMRQAGGSLAFTPLMILSESELRPPWRGRRRLREVEDGAAVLDRTLTETTVEEYRRRLTRHRDNVDALVRRHGGALAAVEVADARPGPNDLDRVVRALLREKVVTS